MLTDGQTHRRTDIQTDGRKVITIAHLEHSSGELKNDPRRCGQFRPQGHGWQDYETTNHCYIQNMLALGLMSSEKIFEASLAI